MRLSLLTALLFGWLAWPGTVAAFSARDDRAHLFSAGAIDTAATDIGELKEQYHKDIRIETYAHVSWIRDPAGRVKKMDAAEQARYFAHWAQMDARKSYVDGLFILICQQPLQVHVVVQLRGQARPFTWEDGEKLQAEMYDLLKEHRNDEALLHAVSFFRGRLIAVHGDTFVNPPFDWTGVGTVLLGVVGVWLALYFLHGFSEGTFRAGNAGINPLGLGIGGNVLAGLRAVREGLTHWPSLPPPLPDHQAPTVTEAPPPSADEERPSAV
jgi:hypothetical protein